MSFLSNSNPPMTIRCRSLWPDNSLSLRLRTKPEEPTLLRSYSLCGPPSTERYRLGIKKESHGAASVYLTTQVKVGDMLEVSPPSGRFVLEAGDRPVVLLSAGIGVTPVLAMLHRLAADPSARIGVVASRSRQ